MFSSTTCLTVVFSCGMAPASYFRRRTVRDHSLLFFTFVLYFQEYKETCLFIIARFSASESLRVYINILKFPPPFASSDGYPASGIRYESVAREFSEPLPHSYSLATARRRVHFSSRFLISLFAFYSYISSYSYLIITSTVI